MQINLLPEFIIVKLKNDIEEIKDSYRINNIELIGACDTLIINNEYHVHINAQIRILNFRRGSIYGFSKNIYNRIDKITFGKAKPMCGITRIELNEKFIMDKPINYNKKFLIAIFYLRKIKIPRLLIKYIIETFI